MKLKYDALIKLNRLMISLESAHNNSCFDDIHEIEFSDTEFWRVTIFVEPVGEFIFQHKDIEAILEYLFHQFQNQPPEWDFKKAGYHLDNMFSNRLVNLELIDTQKSWWGKN